MQRSQQYDLRDQIVTNERAEARDMYTSDEEHSVLEDDSDDELVRTRSGSGDEDGEGDGDYMDEDDDRSSELSIPNESIDFDLVYALHSFAATVEGQANVVKGDSLFLMDDSNSYWWLVRVLKTQEVGYIPAENIETPFERLARLNKHRNVDLASATHAEIQAPGKGEKLAKSGPRAGFDMKSPSPTPGTGPRSDSRATNATNASRRSVYFTPAFQVHRYPPAIWNEDEEEDDDLEWDDEGYSDEDPDLAEEWPREHDPRNQPGYGLPNNGMPAGMNMEPDDGMSWEDGAVEQMQLDRLRTQQQQQQHQLQQQQQQSQQSLAGQPQSNVPLALRAGGPAQQQLGGPQGPVIGISPAPGPGQPLQPLQLRTQSSREQLLGYNDAPASASPISPGGRQTQAGMGMQMDPLQATETRKLSATPSIARDREERGDRGGGGGGDSPGQLGQGQPAQSAMKGSQQAIAAQQQQQQSLMLPSDVMREQEEQRKRTREEIESLAEDARKRNKLQPSPSGKLRKEHPQALTDDEKEGKDGKDGKSKKEKEKEKEREKEKEEKGKKRGMLSGIFGRKKEKDKGAKGIGSDSAAGDMRGSDDSGSRSSTVSGSASRDGHGSVPSAVATGRGAHLDISQSGTQSPVTEAARQQQQNYRNSTNPKPGQTQPQSEAPSTPQQAGRGSVSADGHGSAAIMGGSVSSSPQDASPLSGYSSTLRQHDQQQQQLFQQLLARSPSSPPDVQPSYGLQSASRYGTPLQPVGSAGSLTPSASESTVAAGDKARRQRPGSILFSPSVDGPGVPELSVIRVFAGRHVQTEATFKTVLLNTLTTSDELVRQAMQRFRLPAGEDQGDYYLTIKQVEGSSAVLRPDEKPLIVFESLAEAAMELPKVKRSSVGSISSVASNLSMHPAIRKLPMNDFTDDSAVKFYLNRHTADEDGDGDTSPGHGQAAFGEEGEDTMVAETTFGDEGGSFAAGSSRGNLLVPPNLTINNQGVGAERFSSPSARFPVQVVIRPEDLPDDMVFDPQTEAIVFKNTLRDRNAASQASGNAIANANPGVSQGMRRKVFMFPKNVTVAEVIELGLERFGILEGVVDGGDEVEDKLSKRQSSLRVRYALQVQVNEHERELSPASRVIDAYPRPPNFRVAERPKDSKRRSVDFAQMLLGSAEDVGPEDPVFVLKRAVAYRSSRNRSSAPLDDVALQHLRRDIAANEERLDEAPRQMSKQELIAAQRAASRANQKALLSAQSNSQRGVDVLLPGNAMLRSQRSGADDRMRYSYVDGAGEMYDISDIVEEEWQNEVRGGLGARGGRGVAGQSDLLEGVVGRGQQQQDGLDEKLDRVLSKIKPHGQQPQGQGRKLMAPVLEPPSSATGSTHSVSSAYSSTDEEAIRKPASAPVLTATAPPAAVVAARAMSPAMASARSPTPTRASQRVVSPAPTGAGHSSRSATPTTRDRAHGRGPSVASVGGVGNPSPTRAAALSQSRSASSAARTRPQMPLIPKDDFGISTMLALLEIPNLLAKQPPLPPMDEAEAMLFGRDLDTSVSKLHPDVQRIYASTFDRLREMDKVLEDMFASTVGLVD